MKKNSLLVPRLTVPKRNIDMNKPRRKKISTFHRLMPTWFVDKDGRLFKPSKHQPDPYAIIMEEVTVPKDFIPIHEERIR